MFAKALLCRSWLKFDTVSKKAFNLPLLRCLMLQAAWLKRFYCLVLTLAQVWLMHLHSTRLMLLQSTSQSSLEIDLGVLRLIQSPNQWVDALALNLSLNSAHSMG